jgi:hypothetical protein
MVRALGLPFDPIERAAATASADAIELDTLLDVLRRVRLVAGDVAGDVAETDDAATPRG